MPIPLITSFSGSPQVGPPPLTVNFTDTSDGTIYFPVSWEWNFGDGSPVDTTQNPTHTYTTVGSFTVSLSVMWNNGDGPTDTSEPDYISTGAANTATFRSHSTTSGSLEIMFEVTSGWAGQISWYWDFGDGNTSTVQNPTHTYSTPGTYNVVLTINGTTVSAEPLTDAPSKTHVSLRGINVIRGVIIN